AVLGKTGRNILNTPSHPISTIKEQIYQAFPTFAYYDKIDPVVSTYENFESLCFPEDHPGRAKTDTYYINANTLLRTHTSAHQLGLLKAGIDRESDDAAALRSTARNLGAAPGNERFLVAADVYRRDEIDSSHYPVFHQMEGVCTFGRANLESEVRAAEKARQAIAGAGQGGHHVKVVTQDDTQISASNPVQATHDPAEVRLLIDDMKQSMNLMVASILGLASGGEIPVRWIEAYFPFTSPSWEMEVWFQGRWLEICGCGVIKQTILDNAGRGDRVGWAFGFGLERLAMILFGIPDIRLFWSQDRRFLGQFTPGTVTTFRPFSKHPPCPKDIAFWIPTPTEGEALFHENDFMDMVREIAGDLAEDVKLIDKFTHPKTNRTSHCYRINYCSMDRNVTHAEINEIQNRLRQTVAERFGVELR
ncbi:phenylalanyl-tRNA synthetase alpha subunit, mitochondrial, partial [Spiromyces aspiralis]